MLHEIVAAIVLLRQCFDMGVLEGIFMVDLGVKILSFLHAVLQLFAQQLFVFLIMYVVFVVDARFDV